MCGFDRAFATTHEPASRAWNDVFLVHQGNFTGNSTLRFVTLFLNSEGRVQS